MSALIRFVLLCLQLTFISATFKIPYRCFIWDTGCLTTLSQHATPAFAKGFPDIGTKPLDPMYISSLTIDQGGFKGDVTNLTITGYKDSLIKKMFFDIANGFMSIALQTDLTLNGRYKSFAEDPEADLLMLIKNVDINLITPFEIIKNANNTDIMLLKRYEYSSEIRDAQSYLRDLYFPTFNLPLDKCHLEDSVCMVKAFQNAIPVFIKGIPKLGIEVMDILETDDLKFNVTGLAFTMKNGRLKGLRNMIIDNVKWDVKKLQIDINYHVDYCSLWGQYTAHGRMLILPIHGDGFIKLKFKKLYIKATLLYDTSKKDDMTFAHISSYSCDYDVKGNINYNMTNLFNGNKELSETLLNLMNSNWKQVSQEFGKPLMDNVAKKTFKNINKFLAHSSLEELTLP